MKREQTWEVFRRDLVFDLWLCMFLIVRSGYMIFLELERQD